MDGDLLMYGRHIRIEQNTYEDLKIETGTAGKNRIDLICMTYEKNASDGTETAYLQVVKGAETTGGAAVPGYTNGNILEGAAFNQMPMYKVTLEGVVLKSITPMFAVIPTYKTLAEQYAAQFAATITALKSANILDSMEEVEANTQENMMAGALAMKEHSLNAENPHKVTKAQLGLDKVDNTADMDKPVSKAASIRFQKVESDIYGLGNDIDALDARLGVVGARIGNLVLEDTGAHTLQFTNGKAVYNTTDLDGKLYTQLRNVVVNGFGTEHIFAASITNATPENISISIECVSNNTFTGEVLVAILLFMWYEGGIIAG
jgi:hypothetical protein